MNHTLPPITFCLTTASNEVQLDADSVVVHSCLSGLITTTLYSTVWYFITFFIGVFGSLSFSSIFYNLGFWRWAGSRGGPRRRGPGLLGESRNADGGFRRMYSSIARVPSIAHTVQVETPEVSTKTSEDERARTYFPETWLWKLAYIGYTCTDISWIELCCMVVLEKKKKRYKKHNLVQYMLFAVYFLN